MSQSRKDYRPPLVLEDDPSNRSSQKGLSNTPESTSVPNVIEGQSISSGFSIFLIACLKQLKKFKRKGRRWATRGIHVVTKISHQGYRAIASKTPAALPSITKIFPLLGKALFHVEASIVSKLWPLRYYGMIFLIGGLVMGNGYTLKTRFPDQLLRPAIQRLNFWPLVPTTALTVAKSSLELGHVQLAKTYLDQTNHQLKQLAKWGFDKNLRESYNQTVELLSKPAQKRQQLGEVNQLLEQYPFSIALLISKAQLLAELYQDNELFQTLELITWLNPETDLGELKVILSRAKDPVTFPVAYGDSSLRSE